MMQYIYEQKYTTNPRATSSPIRPIGPTQCGSNIYDFGDSECRSVYSVLNFFLCSAACLFDCTGYNTIKGDYEEYTCRHEIEK